MTHDDLDLMQLAGAGEVLATVDGVEYRAVQVVFSWQPDALPAVYCAYQHWPQTLPARLAAKEAEIAELAAGLERFATEATEQAQRAKALERRVKVLEAQLAAAPSAPLAPETPDGLMCCGTHWKSARSLQMHRQRVHEGMQAGKPRAQSLDDQGWHCTAKGCSGAHARSLLEPDFCTYHAKPAQVNGHAPLVEVSDG
jgi:hypothetical protein